MCLPKREFLRVNKSHIINLGSIKMVDPYFNGEYITTTLYGTKVKVIRVYASEFAACLKKEII